MVCDRTSSHEDDLNPGAKPRPLHDIIIDRIYTGPLLKLLSVPPLVTEGDRRRMHEMTEPQTETREVIANRPLCHPHPARCGIM